VVIIVRAAGSFQLFLHVSVFPLFYHFRISLFQYWLDVQSVLILYVFLFAAMETSLAVQ